MMGISMRAGDVVSVPIHMFRGFKKLDDGVGFLWVVLGQDTPARSHGRRGVRPRAAIRARAPQGPGGS
jgi:hypothetical protein